MTTLRNPISNALRARFDFGGGAREVLLPLLLAVVMQLGNVDWAFQYTDVDQEVRSISVPALTTQLPSSAVDTFRLLVSQEREWTLSELANESEKSKSTVGRHVDALEEAGVVNTRLQTNAKNIEISSTGVLLYRAQIEN